MATAVSSSAGCAMFTSEAEAKLAEIKRRKCEAIDRAAEKATQLTPQAAKCSGSVVGAVVGFFAKPAAGAACGPVGVALAAIGAAGIGFGVQACAEGSYPSSIAVAAKGAKRCVEFWQR